MEGALSKNKDDLVLQDSSNFVHGDSSKKSQKGKASEKSSKSAKTSREVKSLTSKKKEVIRFVGNRSVQHVSVDKLAAVSQLVRQQKQAGKVMTQVDLRRFSDQSIMAFINYIEKMEIKTSLTYYAISEMLTLTKTFIMNDLKLQLEKSLFLSAQISASDLLQAVITCGCSPVFPETELKIYELAAKNFVQLAYLGEFSTIPYYQFVQILGRCDLNVKHEMIAADGALLWLSGQVQPYNAAPAVFGCLRTHFLSAVDRQLIVERAKTLHLSQKVASIAGNILESDHSHRLCVKKEHIQNHYPRCGLADSIDHISEHSTLPLSRPTTFTAKSAKANKEQKKDRQAKFGDRPKVMELMEMDSQAMKREKEKQKKKSKKISKSGKSSHSSTNRSSSRSKSVKNQLKKNKGKPTCACVEYVKKKLGQKRASKSKSRSCSTKSSSKSASSLSKKKSDKSKKKPAKPSSQPNKASKNSSSSMGSKSSNSSQSMSASKTDARRNEKRNKMNKALTKAR